MRTRLLAKSCKEPSSPPDEATFLGHHVETYRAAQAILDATGDDQLSALGLDVPKWKERFVRVVLAAAALHDLGKANSHFQGRVLGERTSQAIRHEWIGYWLLKQQKQLPRSFDEADWNVLLWAVAGHHRKERQDAPESDYGNSDVDLLLDLADFDEYRDWLKSECGLAFVFDLESSNVRTTKITRELQGLEKRDERAWRKAKGLGNGPFRRFVAACKACLIAADVAASALPGALSEESTAIGTEAWIKSALAVRPDEEDLRSLIADRLGKHELREFQRQTAQAPGDVVHLTAGCAAGKTIAAYARAAEQWSGRRVFFCYPTTGTASEGFRGYFVDPNSGKVTRDARLFHSRAEVDLERMLTADDDPDDAPVRCESLAAWSTPIACCTVDTVLGLLQNQRRGIYAWPALAQSAFIFDEIHAYDDRLFGLLLRFLEELPGCPVLLMTASLPASRLDAIRKATQRRNTGKLVELSGPAELEDLPRYRKASADDRIDEIVRAELADGGRVLWISNTVDRTLTASQRFEDLNPLLYHSRFRYIDRVDRHAEVVAAFDRDSKGPALAFCTQVAEMSLDISATLLVTDLAPIPSLIQRLGRLNRFADAVQSDPCRFITITPQSDRGELFPWPYSRENYGDWLPETMAWLGALQPEPLSQTDLVQAWQTVSGEDGHAIVPPCQWLDGGPLTRPDSTREDSYGINVLLEADKPRIMRRERKLVELVIPMPPPRKNGDWRQWNRLRGVLIAPEETINYDKYWGASWQNQ